MLPFPAAGNSLCLGALILAVSQACDEGDRRWYASTLELQLASLELCRACRSVSTLHVLVDEATPRRLWKPVPRSEVPVPTRVPLVRPVGFTWTLPAADIQLISSTPEFISFDVDFNEPIRGVDWPASLQLLRFGGCFDQPVLRAVWPVYLQQLSFGISFDQPIAGISWPTTLRQLTFGYMFNQPILGVAWPTSLQRLVLGDRFNQPIRGVDWPASLRQVCFGESFNQPILGVVWPVSLQVLCFGETLRGPGGGGGIGGGSSGGSLCEGTSTKFRLRATSDAERLRRGGGGGGSDSSGSISDENRNDANLAEFQLRVMMAADNLRASMEGGRGFNQPIAGVVWPASLQHLSFGDLFNQPVLDASWPPSLERISFGTNFKQPIAGIEWPASLQSATRAGTSLFSP